VAKEVAALWCSKPAFYTDLLKNPKNWDGPGHLKRDEGTKLGPQSLALGGDDMVYNLSVLATSILNEANR